MAAGMTRARIHPPAAVARQQLFEPLEVEDVDAHRGQEGLARGLLRVEPEGRGVHAHLFERLALRLLFELNDAPVRVGLEQTEVLSLIARERDHRDGHVRFGLDVARDELPVVHAVEVVAREDEQGVHAPVADVRQDLPHGVRRPLKPRGVLRRLLGGENLDEALENCEKR